MTMQLPGLLPSISNEASGCYWVENIKNPASWKTPRGGVFTYGELLDAELANQLVQGFCLSGKFVGYFRAFPGCG